MPGDSNSGKVYIAGFLLKLTEFVSFSQKDTSYFKLSLSAIKLIQIPFLHNTDGIFSSSFAMYWFSLIETTLVVKNCSWNVQCTIACWELKDLKLYVC